MAAADPDKIRIDAADLANISTTYKDAYDRAIECAKLEIGEMQRKFQRATPPTLPAKFTEPFADYIKLNIEHIDLNTRNADAVAPYVEVKYSFKNGDDENNVVEVVINYDNKAHDPSGDYNSMKDIVRLQRIDNGGFKPKQQVQQNKAVEKLRLGLYPHFGWTVSWGKNGKVHRTGHAYISFKTMEMGRSCRPKEGEQGMAVPRIKSWVEPNKMTGEYVITSFTPKKRRDVQENVDREYKNATDALALSLA